MKYSIILASSNNILYHGTTSLNYDSIKKHGLTIKNQKYLSIGMRMNNVKPLGGIYLGSKERALEYAKNQVKTYGGKPLIVKVLLQYNKYCAIDDDIIIRLISQFIRKPCKDIKEAREKVLIMLKMVYGIKKDKIIDRLIKYSELCHSFDYNKLSIMFGKLIPMMIKTRFIMFNPKNKIRYLHNIGFKGSTRILDIFQKE